MTRNSNKAVSDLSAYQKITEMTRAYQEAAVLMAACQHDLFTVILRTGSMTAADLARTLRLDLRAVTVLLDALCSMNFLRKNMDRYEVREEFADLLNSESLNTFVPMIRHKAACYRKWGMLDKTVKTGHPAKVPVSVRGKDGDHESFILGMNSIARQMIPKLVGNLEKTDFFSFKNMLDLGGATGTYLEAFLEKNPNARGTVFDLPATIEQARKRLTGTRFEKKITLCSGDFYQDEFPAGFDLVWISAIIHQQDSETTRLMFEKSFRALKKKGRIAVRDVFYNEDRTAPIEAGLFSINMLCATEKGKVYTAREVYELLLSAGFKNPRTVIKANNMSSVIIAEK